MLSLSHFAPVFSWKTEKSFLALRSRNQHYSVLKKLLLAEPLEAGISFVKPDIRPALSTTVTGWLGWTGRRAMPRPTYLTLYSRLILPFDSLLVVLQRAFVSEGASHRSPVAFVLVCWPPSGNRALITNVSGWIRAEPSRAKLRPDNTHTPPPPPHRAALSRSPHHATKLAPHHSVPFFSASSHLLLSPTPTQPSSCFQKIRSISSIAPWSSFLGPLSSTEFMNFFSNFFTLLSHQYANPAHIFSSRYVRNQYCLLHILTTRTFI